MADLTTLANVSAWLETEPGQGALITDTDSGLIGLIITAVSDEFERATGRCFAQEQHAETYDGRGGFALHLRNRPVQSVASVMISGQPIPAGGPTVPGYYCDSKRLLLFCYRFAPGAANIAVTYTAGFATIPSDLVRAATQLTATIYRERTHIGLSSQTVAQQTSSYMASQMPKAVADILARYERVVPG